MHVRYPRQACYTAIAIGAAQEDKSLITLAFKLLARQIETHDELKSVIRDIRRVVTFMKAAISVYRT